MAAIAPHLLKIPASLTYQRRNEQFQGSKVITSSVGMVAPLQVSRLRVQAFSGLRASTPYLGSVGSFRTLDFDSKMKDAMFVHRWRPKRGVVKAMFERFTEKAIKVILVAQEETRRLGHNVVGTEQILLGLVGEGTGIAARVLKSAGVSMKNARIEVEKIVGRGGGFIPVEIPFSPRAKRVLELSLEEARKLGKTILLINLSNEVLSPRRKTLSL